MVSAVIVKLDLNLGERRFGWYCDVRGVLAEAVGGSWGYDGRLMSVEAMPMGVAMLDLGSCYR